MRMLVWRAGHRRHLSEARHVGSGGARLIFGVCKEFGVGMRPGDSGFWLPVLYHASI